MEHIESEQVVTPIRIDPLLAARTLGQRCCLRCHQKTSGPARHVCPGSGVNSRVRGRAKRMIAARDGDQCRLCEQPIEDLPPTHLLGPSIDHRIPRASGGTNDLANLQLAHRLCNVVRGKQPLESFDRDHLRSEVARIWARHLARHPQAAPALVIAKRANARAARARRSTRRATDRETFLVLAAMPARSPHPFAGRPII